MNFNDNLPRVGRRSRVHQIERPRYTALWIGIGSTLVGAGASIYSSRQASKNADKAIEAQRQLATDIEYEPIDIEQLKAQATQTAIDNATTSLAVERQLAPDVASARTELARQVNADLALGGKLPADVVNRVSTAGRVAGARSGIGGGATVPLTASLLGLSSIDLINQRRNAAESLVAANPLPVTGLDPGQLASVAIADNNAQNDFNLAQSGVQSNLIQGEANARAAQIGGQTGMASSLANLIGQGASLYSNYKDSRAGVGAKTTYDEFLKRNAPAPSYVPVQTSGFFT